MIYYKKQVNPRIKRLPKADLRSARQFLPSLSNAVGMARQIEPRLGCFRNLNPPSAVPTGPRRKASNWLASSGLARMQALCQGFKDCNAAVQRALFH